MFTVVKMHVLEILILILFFCFSVFKADFYDWFFTGKIDWFEVGLIEIEDEPVFFTGLEPDFNCYLNRYFLVVTVIQKNAVFIA